MSSAAPQDKKQPAKKDAPKLLYSVPLVARPGEKQKLALRGKNLAAVKEVKVTGADGAKVKFLGAKAAGDVATLDELGRDRGFTAEGIALDGGPQVWSSTYIRNCLLAGDVEGAAEALGHPFAVRGEVVKGDQRGRELGYPTANVPTSGMLAVPPDGVYAGWLRRLDQPASALLPAAISVGTNPTFEGERERRVEAYVLDRDDLELYGVPIAIDFYARLRGQVKYAGLGPLIEQMHHDVEDVRHLLRSA